MLRQKCINNIKNVEKDIKAHHGNVQSLMAELNSNFDRINLDGYSDTLTEATYDTSIQLNAGYTVMTGDVNKPWTTLINLKEDKYIFGMKKARRIQKKFPNQNFVVCDIKLDTSRDNHKVNHFKHQYRQLTYYDLLQLIKRFFAVKKQLEDIDGQGVETDLSSIIEILNHAKTDAKHSFIKEALDVVFHSNLADDATDIINHNMCYHSIIIKPYHKSYRAFNHSTHKACSLTKKIVINSINHAISSLYLNFIGNPHQKSIKPYTKKEKLMINQLKKISNMSNINQSITSLANWLSEHADYLEDKYDYSFYDDKAIEDLMLAIDKKPSQKKLKHDRLFWSILSSNINISLVGSLKAKKSLNKYIHHTKSSHEKEIGKQWLQYLNHHSALIMNTNLDDSEPLNNQIRKVTHKDIKFIIHVIIKFFRIKPLISNLLSKWQRKIIQDGLHNSKVVSTMFTLRDKPVTVGDELDFLINSVNDDLEFNNQKTWKKSDLNDASHVLEFINDLKDKLHQE